MDLKSITTFEDNPVTLHFEDQSFEAAFNADLEGAQLAIRKDVATKGILGPVHLLVNAQAVSKYLSAKDFAEWESTEPRNWFHQPGMFDILEVLMGNRNRSESEFTGPTEEMADKYLVISDLFQLVDENCRICPVPLTTCPNRSASFVQSELDLAIANL